MGNIGKFFYYTLGWFLFPVFLNGQTRVRTLILSGDEVLIGKTFISSQKWNLIGGGVKKNESLEDAAKREILEETGHHLKVGLKHIGKYIHHGYRAKYLAHIFVAEVEKYQPKKPREMLSVQWFKLDSLPDNLHPSLELALKLHLSTTN